jgi:hypothetical protein
VKGAAGRIDEAAESSSVGHGGDACRAPLLLSLPPPGVAERPSRATRRHPQGSPVPATWCPWPSASGGTRFDCRRCRRCSIWTFASWVRLKVRRRELRAAVVSQEGTTIEATSLHTQRRRGSRGGFGCPSWCSSRGPME